MKTFRTLSRTALLGLSTAAMLLSSPALAAMPIQAPSVPDPVILASGNCSAIGRQHASQAGGELMRATPETRGGQRVCVIVVRMPAQGGQRPRVDQIVVPAG